MLHFSLFIWAQRPIRVTLPSVNVPAGTHFSETRIARTCIYPGRTESECRVLRDAPLQPHVPRTFGTTLNGMFCRISTPLPSFAIGDEYFPRYIRVPWDSACDSASNFSRSGFCLACCPPLNPRRGCQAYYGLGRRPGVERPGVLREQGHGTLHTRGGVAKGPYVHPQPGYLSLRNDPVFLACNRKREFSGACASDPLMKLQISSQGMARSSKSLPSFNCSTDCLHLPPDRSNRTSSSNNLIN